MTLAGLGPGPAAVTPFAGPGVRGPAWVGVHLTASPFFCLLLLACSFCMFEHSAGRRTSPSCTTPAAKVGACYVN